MVNAACSVKNLNRRICWLHLLPSKTNPMICHVLMMSVQRCVSALHRAMVVVNEATLSVVVETTVHRVLTMVVAVAKIDVAVTTARCAHKAIAPLSSSVPATIIGHLAPKATGHPARRVIGHICPLNAAAIMQIPRVGAMSAVALIRRLRVHKASDLICLQSGASPALLRQRRVVTIHTRCHRCHPMLQQATTNVSAAGAAPMHRTKGTTKAPTNKPYQP